MPQEIRFATFNVCNLSRPGAKLYDNLAPLTADEYAAKVLWTAQQLDQLDADVIGLQEIFSMAALGDVLAHSRRYRDATLCGFDPAPDPVTGAPRLTPQVALISRLPLAGPATAYMVFPDGASLPDGHADLDRFARAPLHAQVLLPDQRIIDVLVIHLKSKRPDFRHEVRHDGHDGRDSRDSRDREGSRASTDNSLLYAQASLRSLIRRGAEAVALRALLSAMDRNGRRPRIILGDFNDTIDAVTTTIVMGSGCTGVAGEELGGRLFDSNQIQLGRDRLRHVGYTHIHEGHYTTIDHVLVSEEFNPASPNAVGEVLDVTYLNDHLLQDKPEASDHGQVLARLRLYPVGETAAA
ncbi:endonuclease/exonuclease/phosphatase [Duganella sp. Leaf126]|uniref:endonuclease/exonuclease/phosphatase family protein n=1 Tax=Duganella sp. Leaf126 TaxID=1736266 RepID=UPI0006FB6F29|nr:endonuclease/exonuclease/phosphatase family protein [Duganella sp. Leaf126]KQQ33887.1 endonuclease/exonuclease/phosphatase [Duganella sp. Leaf126]